MHKASSLEIEGAVPKKLTTQDSLFLVSVAILVCICVSFIQTSIRDSFYELSGTWVSPTDCIIIDDEHGSFVGGLHAETATLNGSVKWNVVPRPEFAVAHTRPPCDSTMERVIDNPRPVP
jgi:hypothetical protein